MTVIAKKFGELPIDLVDGDRSKKYPKKSDFKEFGVPFLNSAAISGGRINFSDSNFITEKKYETITKGRVYENDIVLTTRGNGIGKAALFTNGKYREALINAQMLVIKSRKGEIDPDYLFSLIQSEDFQSQLWKYASGSAQPQIPIRDLKDIPVKIVDYEEQIQIGAIIRTYDNLIENNNRRIAILEEMAQSLYREWFVKFRFPGHENTKFIDSPLGKIPEGWDVSALGRLVNFKRDSVQKGNLPEPIPYMGLEHFPRKSISLSEWDVVTEIGSSKLKYKKGDILFGKIRPYFHKVGVAQVDGICSSDTFVLEAINPKHHALIAMVAFSDEFVAHSVQTSQGTKMPRANWDVLSNYLVPVPNNDLLDEFNKVADTAIEQLRVISKKNHNLKVQRDLLLPKLISGSIQL